VLAAGIAIVKGIERCCKFMIPAVIILHIDGFLGSGTDFYSLSIRESDYGSTYSSLLK